MSAVFLFPGQGAQQVGMLSDLAEASSAAREVFESADAQLGFALSDLCFNGPAERLDATDISQPAMFVSSAAALAAMREALGDGAPVADTMAGLSLGEYTALYAGGAMDFEVALDLVAQRGRLMQAAAEAVSSGMVSIIGLDEDKVRQLCEAAAEGEVLTPANFNCPGQIVISGSAGACERAVKLAEGFGAVKAIGLKVAGAFHSSLMQPAADGLAEVLAGVEIRPPECTVIANVDAQPHTDGESIKQKLIAQVTSPVRWAESMGHVLAAGAEELYEIGPGRVLAGLMRRIDRTKRVHSINSADALAKLAGEQAG